MLILRSMALRNARSDSDTPKHTCRGSRNAAKSIAVLTILFVSSGCTHVYVRGQTEFDVSRTVRGPRAEIAIGYERALTDSLTARVELEHQSFLIDRRDRGEETANVAFTWRPWR